MSFQPSLLGTFAASPFEGLPSAEASAEEVPSQIASQYVWLQSLCCDWSLPSILTSRSLKLVGTANSPLRGNLAERTGDYGTSPPLETVQT